MQTIIDLDLRQAIGDFGFKSPAIPYAGKSQDTQSHEIYFVQGGVVQDLGTSPAIKFGLIGPGGPSLLVLQTSYTRQVDVGGNVFYLGFPIFNTSNLANALGSNTSIACISEVRYQLSTGEIEHTLDIPITIFRTILSEITSDTTTAAFTAPAVGANVTIAIGNTTWLQINQQLTIATAGIYQVISITDATHFVAQNTGQPGNATSGTVIASGSAVAGAPVNALTTYPPSNTLELISTRDVASGHAGLTAAKLLNPVVIPVDNVTIQILDGQIASSFILAETAASFVTPAANATVNVTLVSSTGLVVGQYVRLPVAGYYIVQSIPDSTHVVLQNNGDPVNAASGVTVPIDTPLLPAQAAAGGGSAGQNAYTTTTASFTVPAAGSTVSVAVVSTAWMGGSGYYVFITGAGYYAINSITDTTHAVLTNTGSASNAIAGTTVASGVTVTAAGPAGAAGTPGTPGAALSAYDALASPFTMPAAAANVTISIANTAWLAVGQVIYIASAGYFQVASISSATQALITNLNYPGNASAGGTIASGSKVSAGGLIGATGSGGAGKNAFTNLAANFTQPAVNATVSINVGTTAWMAVAQIIFVQGGGYYSVASITDLTDAVVANLGYAGNASPGATVTSGSTIAVTPGGVAGQAGRDAFTLTTASFTMPAAGSPVTVAVGSSAWIAQGQNLYVAGAGYFSVSAITDGTHVVLTNSGVPGNVVSGTVIASGAQVSAAGSTGLQGATGATGPSGGIGEAPTDGQIYGRQNSAWTVVTSGGGGPVLPSARVFDFEDFDSSITANAQPNGKLGWLCKVLASGSITSASNQGLNATDKANGVWSFGGAITGDYQSISLGDFTNTAKNTLVPGLGILTLEFRVGIVALPTGSQDLLIKFGLCAGASSLSTATPPDGVYFEYWFGNAITNWQFTTVAGGTATNTTTGTAAVAGGYHKFQILTNAGWTSIQALIDGVVKATNTAHIPTNNLCPFMVVGNLSTASWPSNVYIDYFFKDYQYTR